ncbi:hypothetical protein HKX48_005793 [Thoreauomyces humboldtii]|nr:hypothetical protein HKX48_005793 [Thoreauomyces humboldtii]
MADVTVHATTRRISFTEAPVLLEALALAAAEGGRIPRIVGSPSRTLSARREEEIRSPPPFGACVPRSPSSPNPDHGLGQGENANLFFREKGLREAFDAYATLFGGLVEDHALLAKAPGASMMKVYVDNTNLLRTIADALVTPRLPVSRNPEIWSLRGCRGRLIDPIDLLPLEPPHPIDEEEIERSRQQLPAQVSDLVRNRSLRGTPTFENFRWGVAVAVGWLHVQNVEGMEGDILPAGNWINKYKKKLGLNAEEVSGHCAAIGAHTNGFKTPVGGHVYCYEASKHWLEKEGRSRRFHFILPLCPAHNASTAIMKIKPNFPMLMVNSLESCRAEGDWTRSNGTLGASVNLQGKAGRNATQQPRTARHHLPKFSSQRSSSRPTPQRHASTEEASKASMHWSLLTGGAGLLLPDQLESLSFFDSDDPNEEVDSPTLRSSVTVVRPLPQRHTSTTSSKSDPQSLSRFDIVEETDRPVPSRHSSASSNGSESVPRRSSRYPLRLEQRIRAVFERKDHGSDE